MTNPLLHATTMTYSVLGLPVSRHTDSFDVVDETFDSGGSLATRTVGTSTWKFTNGPMGELLSVEQPVAPPAAGQEPTPGDTYRYTYAADRKLLTLTPPGGVTQTWAYDEPLRRLTRRTRGTSTWTTTYPDAVATTMTPLSRQVREVSDARGRTAQRTYDSAVGLRDVTTRWSGDDQPLLVDEKVRLASGTDETRTTTWGYDGRDRVTSIARGGVPTVGYGYVGGDRSLTIQRSVGGGHIQNDTFDALGRLDVVHTAAADFDFTYEVGGLIKSVVSPLLTETWTYSPTTDKRLQRIDHTPTAQPSQSFEYTYDARGNRLTESIDGATTRYAYDAADRLTGVRFRDGEAKLFSLRGDGARVAQKQFSGYPEAFGAFDETPAGATLLAHEAFHFNTGDGLQAVQDVLQSATTPIVTDAAGREVQAFGASRVFDDADRMVSSTTGGVTSTFRYDAQGWRVAKSDSSGDRAYVWGAHGMVAEGPTLATLATAVSAGGLELGLGADIYGHDALGSVVLRTRAGSFTGTEFDPFGATRGVINVGGASDSARGFTGHVNDDSGLVYARARYLNPSTGRFLSLDPVAGALDQPLSTQGYTYANANPTRFSDPDGRVAMAVCAGIGAVVGTLAGAATAYHNDTNIADGMGLGAVGGFLTGATCGASLLVGAGVGAGVGAVTGTIGALETANSVEEVQQAGAIGLVGGGLGGFVGAGAAAGTSFAARHVTSTAARVGLNFAADGAVSAASQLALTGDIDPVQVGIDALAGAGTRFGHAKWGRRVSTRERHSGVLRSVDYDSNAEVDAWAAFMYDEVRSVGYRDVDRVSMNTGIDIGSLRAMKKHMFFDFHDIPVVNQKTQAVSMRRSRFDPDLDVAEAWLKARSGPLLAKQQKWFEKLIAHEVTEAGLEAKGIPHRDPNSWDPVREAWAVSDGAHDLANRTALQPPAGFPDD